ncbi:hypothetical protein scyTo_0024973 [Scyliorhinus torazame]|uniref:Uncharacterized protein n=1 Tax=Scyliorhinus torazame TaxID=75743 RepID=A0A401QFT1_SCYTO|nr:hypothetical protein [Scyliorhinus torazame]
MARLPLAPVRIKLCNDLSDALIWDTLSSRVTEDALLGLFVIDEGCERIVLRERFLAYGKSNLSMIELLGEMALRAWDSQMVHISFEDIDINPPHTLTKPTGPILLTSDLLQPV